MDLQLEESVGIIGKMPDGLLSHPPQTREAPIVHQGGGVQANQKQPSPGGDKDPGSSTSDST